MNWQFFCTFAGLGIAVLGHAFATIKWASKMTFVLERIQEQIKEIKDELKEDGVKKDAQFQAIWKRVDDMKDRILVLEQND